VETRNMTAVSDDTDERGKNPKSDLRRSLQQRFARKLRVTERRQHGVCRQKRLRLRLERLARPRHMAGGAGEAQGVETERLEKLQRLSRLHPVVALVFIARIENGRETRFRNGGNETLPGNVEQWPQQADRSIVIRE